MEHAQRKRPIRGAHAPGSATVNGHGSAPRPARPAAARPLRRRAARRRGLGLRAQVGRVPRDRVRRRRRGRACSRAAAAPGPLLPRARRCRRGAWCSTARSSSTGRRPPGLRGAPAAHPPGGLPRGAAGRARRPARFVAFDLLALGDEALLERPFAERRAALARGRRPRRPHARRRPTGPARSSWLREAEGVDRQAASTPPTCPASAGAWSRSSGCARSTAWWWAGGRARAEGTVGSLILGLYEPRRAPGRRRAQRRLHRAPQARPGQPPGAVRDRRARHAATPAAGRRAGSSSGSPLRPELVVEVSFDHVSGRRIRHGAKVLRLRDDASPAECTIDQLDS